MIQAMRFTGNGGRLDVELERTDVLIKSEEEIVNFPRLIRLSGDKWVLAYGRGRHGGEEGRLAAYSEDDGMTWQDFPAGSPWNDNVQTSGVLGYLHDGLFGLVVHPRAECLRHAVSVDQARRAQDNQMNDVGGDFPAP